MVQSLKRLTLGLGSRHDLTVCEFEPHIGFHADSAEPAWDSLFSSLSALAPLVLSVFLSKINEHKKNFKVCEMNDVRGLI